MVSLVPTAPVADADIREIDKLAATQSATELDITEQEIYEYLSRAAAASAESTAMH